MALMRPTSSSRNRAAAGLSTHKHRSRSPQPSILSTADSHRGLLLSVNAQAKSTVAPTFTVKVTDHSEPSHRTSTSPSRSPSLEKFTALCSTGIHRAEELVRRTEEQHQVVEIELKRRRSLSPQRYKSDEETEGEETATSPMRITEKIPASRPLVGQRHQSSTLPPPPPPLPIPEKMGQASPSPPPTSPTPQLSPASSVLRRLRLSLQPLPKQAENQPGISGSTDIESLSLPSISLSKPAQFTSTTTTIRSNNTPLEAERPVEDAGAVKPRGSPAYDFPALRAEASPQSSLRKRKRAEAGTVVQKNRTATTATATTDSLPPADEAVSRSSCVSLLSRFFHGGDSAAAPLQPTKRGRGGSSVPAIRGGFVTGNRPRDYSMTHEEVWLYVQTHVKRRCMSFILKREMLSFLETENVLLTRPHLFKRHLLREMRRIVIKQKLSSPSNYA